VAGFFVRLVVVIVIGLPVACAEGRAGLPDRLRPASARSASARLAEAAAEKFHQQRRRQGFGESAVALAKAEARNEQNERRRVIAPPGPKPVGPYSPGILADDFLYVSGQGGRDAEGKLPATIDGQVRQTLQNVKVIVEAAGLTMEHVVYSQVYLVDMAHYDAMERGWREFFPKAAPARAVLGV